VSAMLSIGVFTYSTRPRGSVVHAMSLAESLVAAGHDATLYALAKPGATLQRDPGCRVELLPARAAPSATDALVRQRIDEFMEGVRRVGRAHDVFHAQDCLAASALLALRARGVGPVVRTVHHVERYDSVYLADCQRRSICDADAVFSVSRMTQAHVREQFDRESALVPNGVDVDRFALRRIDVEERLRRRYRIEPGDTLVLSVGGVEPRKNTVSALEAVAAASCRAPGIRWIIVGDHSIWDHSAYIAEFEAVRSALPAALQSRVIRAGTLPEDELTSLFALADMLLCPSREEGFGLCVLEAMAAGAAVVVPARAPFSEYLDPGCAAFVDPGSTDDIAAALVSLATDRRRRTRLAEAARQGTRRFSWSASAEQHLRHYRELLSTEASVRALDERPAHA
jgi:glycosyltransferase-like protein